MAEIDETPETQEEARTGEEPQIYDVKKDLAGWNFSRREFLAAAAAAAAAATAGAMAAPDDSNPDAREAAGGIGAAVPLAIRLPVVQAAAPGEAISQAWHFTNQSPRAWCRGVRLQLVDAEQLGAPASFTLPDLAPGQTYTLKVDLVAPGEPGSYQAGWRLEAGDRAEPLAAGPFVVLTLCLAESSHPYADNMNQTWEVVNPDANAQSTRVHFSQVDVEDCCDNLYVKDSGGVVHQTISGYYDTGLWSNPVPGRTVRVQLVSDSSIAGWGFCLDQVETLQIAYLPIVFYQPTPTPTNTPCRCYGVCSCDNVCTCDTVHYWYPN